MTSQEQENHNLFMAEIDRLKRMHGPATKIVHSTLRWQRPTLGELVPCIILVIPKKGGNRDLRKKA